MPKDKLDQQWSANDTHDANTYTQDQGQEYKSQAQIGNRPKGNRATHDAQGDGNYPVKQIKPVQPDCDGLQFARNPYDADNYLDVKIDAWDNEIPKDRPMHGEMPMGDKGSFGGRQYAKFQRNSQDGYGVEIPHGQSAAFNTPTTVWVANGRADRGPEFVESNSDAGIIGNGKSAYDNNNVARGSVPPIMRNRGR